MYFDFVFNIIIAVYNASCLASYIIQHFFAQHLYKWYMVQFSEQFYIPASTSLTLRNYLIFISRKYSARLFMKQEKLEISIECVIKYSTVWFVIDMTWKVQNKECLVNAGNTGDRVCSRRIGRKGFWELHRKTSPTLIHIEECANLSGICPRSTWGSFTSVQMRISGLTTRNLVAAVSRRFPLRQDQSVHNGCSYSIFKTSDREN